jgi:hypothetical protein
MAIIDTRRIKPDFHSNIVWKPPPPPIQTWNRYLYVIPQSSFVDMYKELEVIVSIYRLEVTYGQAILNFLSVFLK